MESSLISAAKSATEHASANAVTAWARRTFIRRFSVAQIAAVAERVARKAATSIAPGRVRPCFTTDSSKSFKNVPSGRKHVKKSEICASVRIMKRTNRATCSLPRHSASDLWRNVSIGT